MVVLHPKTYCCFPVPVCGDVPVCVSISFLSLSLSLSLSLFHVAPPYLDVFETHTGIGRLEQSVPLKYARDADGAGR